MYGSHGTYAYMGADPVNHIDASGGSYKNANGDGSNDSSGGNRSRDGEDNEDQAEEDDDDSGKGNDGITTMDIVATAWANTPSNGHWTWYNMGDGTLIGRPGDLPLGITIYVDATNIVIYLDGRLYNTDGTDYKGKYHKESKSGTVKYTGFLGQVYRALNLIIDTPSGAELIAEIPIANIKFTTGDPETKKITVYWNPYHTTAGLDVNGSRATKPFIVLAHELGHVHTYYLYFKSVTEGNFGLSRDITNDWITLSSGRVITNEEIYATHWENRIRAESGLPLREYYAIDNGKGAGRLLIEGTNLSSYFVSNTFIQISTGIIFYLPYQYE